eukprot:CAMPEP_0168615016 /NCGR_PEP_ID=MMETSP0449_2-20121227/4282_1 /TAXON_ID=1082188 /ORGANISM="Strombidium rassoulzadegani, Strain ras09" /LENGTH=132 /DNA_ID=CAMNT_0008655733 /DNA_START=428 /DNA_END=826 /DNA_ORIENTATION=-
MPACYYLNSRGLNDTLVFQADTKQQTLVGFHVQYRDIKYLASLERNPKKKRLMQERQFSLFAGSAELKLAEEGKRALFSKIEYDSQGHEQIVKKTAADGTPSQPEQEKSFIQKYWWQMLIGFMVIQTLSGGA